jgi:uncharacterized membrane protein YhaH (DUF805 family)
MGFTQAIKSCWNKYATFSGRAPRSEYWFFQLFVFLGLMILGVLGILLGVAGGQQQADAGAGTGAGIGIGIVGLLAIVFIFGVLVPQISVSVRRLHDTNASGWFFLLFILPYVGGLIAIVWGCIPGTQGPNKYGPSPLDTPADAFT